VNDARDELFEHERKNSELEARLDGQKKEMSALKAHYEGQIRKHQQRASIAEKQELAESKELSGPSGHRNDAAGPVLVQVDKATTKATRAAAAPAPTAASAAPNASASVSSHSVSDNLQGAMHPVSREHEHVDSVLREAVPTLRWALAEIGHLQDEALKRSNDPVVKASEELCLELEHNNLALHSVTKALERLQNDYDVLFQQSVLHQAQSDEQLCRARVALKAARKARRTRGQGRTVKDNCPIVNDIEVFPSDRSAEDGGDQAGDSDQENALDKIHATLASMHGELEGAVVQNKEIVEENRTARINQADLAEQLEKCRQELLDCKEQLEGCREDSSRKSAMLAESAEATQRAKESFFLSLQAEQEAAEEVEGALRKRVEQLELMVAVEQDAARAVEADLRSKLDMQHELDAHDGDGLPRPEHAARAHQSAAGRPSSVPTLAAAGYSVLPPIAPALLLRQSPRKDASPRAVLDSVSVRPEPASTPRCTPRSVPSQPSPRKDAAEGAQGGHALPVKSSNTTRALRAAAPRVLSPERKAEATRGPFSILGPNARSVPQQSASPELMMQDAHAPATGNVWPASSSVYGSRASSFGRSLMPADGRSGARGLDYVSQRGHNLSADAPATPLPPAFPRSSPDRQEEPLRQNELSYGHSPQIYSPFVSALEEFVNVEE
jgi:hypothetical protein